LNYDDLQLELRVNGQVLQKERTCQMAQNVAALVSHASQHVTLEPATSSTPGTPARLPP